MPEYHSIDILHERLQNSEWQWQPIGSMRWWIGLAHLMHDHDIGVVCEDGRPMNWPQAVGMVVQYHDADEFVDVCQLLVRLHDELRCDDVNAFYGGCMHKTAETHVCVLGRERITTRTMCLEVVRSDESSQSDKTLAAAILGDLHRRVNMRWSRLHHSEAKLGAAFVPTNVRFGTLLLGLGRLVATGVIEEAHGSMLEEMLESWRYTDGLWNEPIFLRC